MYDRTIDGTTYTFGVSGKLIRNVLVMFDWQTDSLWSQLLGVAVDGTLSGTQLAPIPALQTTWSEWKRLYPETTALAIGGPAYDSYDSYYTSNRAGVIGETHNDTRLARKELIHGLVVNGQPIAYPFSRLAQERIVNDLVGDAAVLVTYAPDSRTAAAFRREVDGAQLSFQLTAGEQQGIMDRETGSEWSLLTGVAISGPMAGKQLERIPGTSSFWFGWKDFYTDTRVYGE